MIHWTWLLLPIFVGPAFGFLLYSIMKLGKEADDAMEQEQEES